MAVTSGEAAQSVNQGVIIPAGCWAGLLWGQTPDAQGQRGQLLQAAAPRGQGQDGRLR